MTFRWVSWGLLACLGLASCRSEEPAPSHVSIAPDHRACQASEECVIVETSCQSSGCECGTAIHRAYLAEYEQKLSECRGDKELTQCESSCETPFAKCFRETCVLTKEPQEVVRKGQSLSEGCTSTGGEFLGCPECPPGELCKGCVPCSCPPRHRWGPRKGCRLVVKTEPHDIEVRVRRSKLTRTDKVMVQVENLSNRPVRLLTKCNTPLSSLRRKEDNWELSYGPFTDKSCKTGTVEIKPGKSRSFALRNLKKFSGPDGGPLEEGTYRFDLGYTESRVATKFAGIVFSDEFDLVGKR